MADKKKAFKYFTFIIYPEEFPASSIPNLKSLGTMMISPLHTPACESPRDPNDIAGTSLKALGTSLASLDFTDFDDDFKVHYHCICKSGSKMTEISFMQKVCEALNNDLHGIAVNPQNCGVADPSLLIRYFYHLDHPHKQQFDFDLSTLDVPKVFFEECKKAFTVELSFLIQSCFVICDSLNSLYYHINKNCSPFVSWIFWNSKNTYLISQLYKEQRELEKQERSR